MGLLQAAYRTYESQAHLAGVPVQGKETLTPPSHMIQKAQIEITLDETGRFRDAKAVSKEEFNTIIPATEESASRSGNCDRPHPLCDQLLYLAAYGGSKHDAYRKQLTEWAGSAYSHPKVRAVLQYISGGTILTDLLTAGILTLDNEGKPAAGKIEATDYNKCLVRWRVLSATGDVPSTCWEDHTLFDAFRNFYDSLQQKKEQDICILSGQPDVAAGSHPKGVIAANFSAKLISANDSSGFTYRGRFTEARQAGTVGYTASQKAHSALRWVAANYGVIMGGRTFLWWNPAGKELPSFGDFLRIGFAEEPQSVFVSYKQAVLHSLSGYRQELTAADDVAVAALDAATTGRLSVTYYNEMKANDFLDRLQNWYDTCCWDTRFYGVQSPPLRQIVNCAFGTQRDKFIEADERVLSEHIQRLLHCVIDCQPIPADIVRALAVKASTPLAYNVKDFNTREQLLYTACAVVRKYRNDQQQKEEWFLSLDENNRDRSYLFGRLLAVAEQVERSTYSNEESRETNAIRMQSVFSQRPAYAWRIIHESLNPYFQRLQPGLRIYYKNIIQEIVDSFDPNDRSLNKKLDDTYLLGYYHQRAALTKKKKDQDVTEENENESAE